MKIYELAFPFRVFNVVELRPRCSSFVGLNPHVNFALVEFAVLRLSSKMVRLEIFNFVWGLLTARRSLIGFVRSVGDCFQKSDARNPS